MSNEQLEYLVKPPPQPEREKRILLLDPNPTSRDSRARALRDRGAHVDCVGGGEDARTLWKPGSHELVLIELRSAGTDIHDFYGYAHLMCKKQKFGFYVDGPPYLRMSQRQGESTRGQTDCLPTEGLPIPEEIKSEDGRFQTGLPEAARRIAAVRRLTRPGTTDAGARLRGTSVSEAMKIANRVLGGGAA